jgi:chemotaxis protein methyltransferase CheR
MSLSALSTAKPAAGENAIAAADFDVLRKLLVDKAGIVLEPNQAYLAEARLPPVARQYQLRDIAQIIATLRTGRNRELEIDVIDAFTTNETSFFRDSHPFDDFVKVVMPELLAARNPSSTIRIWCGACSSGQEPYTLAMLFNEHFPDLVSGRRIKILATDLSRTMVARTNEGRYSQFEVNRGLPAPMLIKYFDQVGRDWQAKPELRSMIEAKECNLLEAWPMVPKCDIVFLRNVLIYFSGETKSTILERIRTQVLTPDGYLFLGSSETTLNLATELKAMRFDRGQCYRP